MSHRILLTGASGYLGGTLLARWKTANLPPHEKLYALVRTDDQGKAVKSYGAEPLSFNVKDEASTREAIVGNKINVVFFLIDAMKSDSQVLLIKALAEVKKLTGLEVHFLHVSCREITNSNAMLIRYLERPVAPKYSRAMLAHLQTGSFSTMSPDFTMFRSLKDLTFLFCNR
jgi:hypothetical protein